MTAYHTVCSSLLSRGTVIREQTDLTFLRTRSLMCRRWERRQGCDRVLCLRGLAFEITKTAEEYHYQRETGIWFFSSLMYQPKTSPKLKVSEVLSKVLLFCFYREWTLPQGYWHFRWFQSKRFWIFPSVISLFPRDAPHGMNTYSGWAR